MKHGLIVFSMLLGCGGCLAPTSKTGRSEVEFLTSSRGPASGDPGRKLETSDIRINYIAAHPRRALVKPEYPAQVLKSGGRSYVMYVTFTVNESGQVSDVRRSWTRLSPPEEFGDLFMEAARQAIAQWDIEPARQVYWQTNPDGEDRYLRTELVPERFEVKFTFDVSGDVR